MSFQVESYILFRPTFAKCAVILKSRLVKKKKHNLLPRFRTRKLVSRADDAHRTADRSDQECNYKRFHGSTLTGYLASADTHWP